jgi:hypothetical protein
VNPESLRTPPHAETSQPITEIGVHTVLERDQIDIDATASQVLDIRQYL